MAPEHGTVFRSRGAVSTAVAAGQRQLNTAQKSAAAALSRPNSRRNCVSRSKRRIGGIMISKLFVVHHLIAECCLALRCGQKWAVVSIPAICE
jgi:hypothetical protein